ncbi:hypothetical protein [Streptomyces sp. NPDC023588]|uniref:hypothetical protein n=1 Tax=Streptomyces sp. NPDC023588 TaxID=3154907 RepID=UPI0033DEE6D4
MIVEGKDLDARFYDRVCGSSAEVGAAGYQIWLAEQLKDDSTGAVAAGKKAVLGHFSYFETSGKLTVSSSSGKHAVAFMVDRDNEDVCGGRIGSPHVIYTDMFDVESEAFFHGDDAVALAEVLSLDANSANQLAADLNGWIVDISEIWREWLTLCTVAKAAGAGCDVGFGRESWINDPKYGAVDTDKLTAAELKLAESTRHGSVEYDAISARVRSEIDACFGDARGHRLIKGKWLASYLIYRVKDHFGSAPVTYKGAEDFVARAYLAACDFKENWVDHYRVRLELLI